MTYHSLERLKTPRSLYRALAALLSTTTTALLSFLLPLLSSNADLNPQNENSIAVGLPLAGTVWSLLHNGSLLLAVAMGASWHPGVDVALDCLGWMLNWGVAIVVFVYAAMFGDVESICEESRTNGPGLCQAAKKVAGIEYTGGALCLVVG